MKRKGAGKGEPVRGGPTGSQQRHEQHHPGKAQPHDEAEAAKDRSAGRSLFAGDVLDRPELRDGLLRGRLVVEAGFAGTAAAFESSLANQPLLILAAIVTVYIVLGVLYESLVHPVTILSTLPSAGVGALAALLHQRLELGVISLIGIILLIGIVKKNAIMMIDFALDASRHGIDGRRVGAREAIEQACLLRFRPIMMTTMAALLGAVPLAIGTGVGSELRRPLGITIIGGLLVSQVLTLYTTPVIYLWFDAVGSWLRARRPAAVEEPA